MYYNQSPSPLRFEWGIHGLQHTAQSNTIIIVDVLSFSTCVDIAVGNGAVVYPYRYHDASAQTYATRQGAQLATAKRTTAQGYSLSPTSLQCIPAGTKLVLPSPNGSTLSLAAQAPHIVAGCLRNASAAAHAAQQYGQTITVLAAGERWPDGSIRFAVEDMLGAGAILTALSALCSPSAPCSPEAHIAMDTFRASAEHLDSILSTCSSGRELIERGFANDVALAAQYNCSTTVPVLRNGAFYNQKYYL